VDAQLRVGSLAANLVERAGSLDSNSSVRARSTSRRRGGRAAAVPPFSGPRSRATVDACDAQPHQQRCALQPWGATANGTCAQGHHHRPDASRVACHAFACHPRARADGLGQGRRHHSRWPRRAHEQTLLMARRLRPENGAPRAWAGERAPGRLPCYTLARSLRRISASGRALRIVTGGAPDAQFGGRLSGGELSEASRASRPSVATQRAVLSDSNAA
jgi:hypothetical protein